MSYRVGFLLLQLIFVFPEKEILAFSWTGPSVNFLIQVLKSPYTSPSPLTFLSPTKKPSGDIFTVSFSPTEKTIASSAAPKSVVMEEEARFHSHAPDCL
jgi:hypothetical protein